MNNTVEIDLDNVKTFVENSEFHRYLLENTLDFPTAAWILQTLLNAIDEVANSVDNTENI